MPHFYFLIVNILKWKCQGGSWIHESLGNKSGLQLQIWEPLAIFNLNFNFYQRERKKGRKTGRETLI